MTVRNHSDRASGKNDDTIAHTFPRMSFEEMEFRAERLYKDICKTLGELRRQRKLSQRDLASRSGLGQGYICDIEKGKGNPTWSALSALCAALNTSLSALILQTVVNNRGATPEQQTQFSELATLLQDLADGRPLHASKAPQSGKSRSPSRRRR